MPEPDDSWRDDAPDDAEPLAANGSAPSAAHPLRRFLATLATGAAVATLARRRSGTPWPRASDVDRLASEISVLRYGAYNQQLGDLARVIGVTGDVTLRDKRRARAMVQESREVARGVVRTNARDRAVYARSLPADLSTAERAAALKRWQRERAVWKASEIAVTEGGRARQQAVRDVVRENGFRVRMRAIPEDAQEPICEEIVDRGWMSEVEASAYSLPAHPHCKHSWDLDERELRAAAAERESVWLGGDDDG